MTIPRPLVALTLAALAAAVLAPASAFAGGYLHGKSKGCCMPRPVCKQKVYVPPVTRTVHKKVMVSPGSCVKRRVPAVYGWRERLYVARPGQERVVSVPPVYGMVDTVQQVSPGYVATGYRRKGRCLYKCAVAVPPKHVRTKQPVELAPARTWVERTPPVMGMASERVMLQPEYTQQFCQPPVYRVVAKEVVVSPGGWAWRPSGAVGCGRY